MSHNYELDFYTCDKAFIDCHQADVGPAAAAVYQVLCRHCGRDGRCWPGLERLCALTGLKRRTVQTALKRLAAAAVIRIEPHASETDGRGAAYVVLPLPRRPPEDAPAKFDKAPPAAPGIGAANGKIGADPRDRKAPSAPILGAASGARRGLRSCTEEGGEEPPPPETADQDPSEGPPRPSASILAHCWAERQTIRPNGRPADPAEAVEGDFDELLRVGFWFVELLGEIDRPGRNRFEYFSHFRVRVLKWPGRRAPAVRRPTPAEADTASLAPPATPEQYARLGQVLSGIAVNRASFPDGPKLQ